jgi:serine/threonine protein phosphatase PrpC
MAAALAAPAIDGIAAGLIDRALLRGGRDNVSAIVVEVRR